MLSFFNWNVNLFQMKCCSTWPENSIHSHLTHTASNFSRPIGLILFYHRRRGGGLNWPRFSGTAYLNLAMLTSVVSTEPNRHTTYDVISTQLLSVAPVSVTDQGDLSSRGARCSSQGRYMYIIYMGRYMNMDVTWTWGVTCTWDVTWTWDFPCTRASCSHLKNVRLGWACIDASK